MTRRRLRGQKRGCPIGAEDSRIKDWRAIAVSDQPTKAVILSVRKTDFWRYGIEPEFIIAGRRPHDFRAKDPA